MTRPFTLANDDLIFAVSGTAPPADYVAPVHDFAPSHTPGELSMYDVDTTLPVGAAFVGAAGVIVLGMAAYFLWPIVAVGLGLLP